MQVALFFTSRDFSFFLLLERTLLGSPFRSMVGSTKPSLSCTSSVAGLLLMGSSSEISTNSETQSPLYRVAQKMSARLRLLTTSSGEFQSFLYNPVIRVSYQATKLSLGKDLLRMLPALYPKQLVAMDAAGPEVLQPQ